MAPTYTIRTIRPRNSAPIARRRTAPLQNESTKKRNECTGFRIRITIRADPRQMKELTVIKELAI
jgi:hypothetical protein